MRRKSVKLGLPRAPRRDCRSASRWRRYYTEMALWKLESERILRPDHPSVADACRAAADNYQDGVQQIDARTHPSIVNGRWI